MKRRIVSFEPLESKCLLSTMPGCEDMAMHVEGLAVDEHKAVLALVPCESATHVALGVGQWSDPAVWSNQEIPGEGADVLIAYNADVELDGVLDFDIRTVRVSGHLSFADDVDTALRVDTLVVDPCGTLTIGAPGNRIRPDVEARIDFTDAGEIDKQWDPFRFSRGLISMGTVSIYGTMKQPHARLGLSALEGDRSLTFSEDPGWEVGDLLLVPGVVRPNENISGRTTVDQDEFRVIEGVAGRTVYFDEPLQYDHKAPTNNLTTLPVANFTRNVVLQSVNKVERNRSAHVMFMHTPNASIDSAAFLFMGRNDKSRVTTDPQIDMEGNVVAGTDDNPRGRYALHFHRAGFENYGSVTNSVVTHSPGWGFVNHESFVHFEGNVSYNVKGSGFVAEAGNELGSFRGNMAFRSRGKWFSSSDTADSGEGTGFGSEGNGFWIQSPLVEVVNNVASGHAQEGFFFNNRQTLNSRTGEKVFVDLDQIDYADDLPAAQRWYNDDRSAISPQVIPFKRVHGNEVFASGAGIGIRWHRFPLNYRESNYDTISGTVIWNVKWSGVKFGYSANVAFDRIAIINDDNQHSPLSPRDKPENWNNGSHAVQDTLGKGFIGNVSSSNVSINHAVIAGFGVGIQALRKGQTLISNASLLANEENIRIVTPQATQFGLQRRVYINDVKHHPDTMMPINLVYSFNRPLSGVGGDAAYEFQSLIDPDGIWNNGHRLYFSEQAADATPFPADEAPDWMLESPYRVYLDNTNEELWSMFGIALGGAISCSI